MTDDQILTMISDLLIKVDYDTWMRIFDTQEYLPSHPDEAAGAASMRAALLAEAKRHIS